jgi:hypothetical protein
VAVKNGSARWLTYRRCHWFLVLLLCGFGAPVGVRLAGYITRAMYLPEITFNEGWNAYYAHDAAAGVPLYGKRPDRLVNNYPPLSFHLVGAIAGPTGDVNRIGRIVSLVALCWVALCAAFLARRFSGDAWAGGFAALFCVGWFVFFVPGSVGVNEPQMLAHAVILTGVALYWAGLDSTPMLAAACAICCIGGFVKHTQVAFPLALTLDLLWRSRKRLWVWIAAASVTTAILFALTIRMDGPYFLAHLFTPRRPSASTALVVSGVYLCVFLPAIAISLFWCIPRMRAVPVRFLLTVLAASTVIGVFFTFGSGVAVNVFYEGMIAMSIIAGWVMSDIAKRACAGKASWLPMLVAVPLLVSAGPVVAGFYSSAPPRKTLAEADRIYRQDIAYLVSKPGPAICLDLVLCYSAGKPLEYDPFFSRELIGTGRLDGRIMAGELASQKYSVIQADDSDSYFPTEMMAALKSRYRAERRSGGRTFFVPAP